MPETAVQEIYGRIAMDLKTSFRGYDGLESESPIGAILKVGEMATNEKQVGRYRSTAFRVLRLFPIARASASAIKRRTTLSRAP